MPAPWTSQLIRLAQHMTEMRPRTIQDLIVLDGSRGPSYSSLGDTRVQAIYVPTKGRPSHLKRLLDDLEPVLPVYVLPTSPEDIPDSLREGRISACQLLPESDSDFWSFYHSLRSTRNPLFSVPESTWDLPAKRSYALWHASQNRLTRIVLVDDDIRGLTNDSLSHGGDALCNWPVVGYLIRHFPDTSFVGHLELSLGEPYYPFLSGSCLFLHIGKPLGFFPPIYNEDWIFMAPAIADRRVSAIGSIDQAPYDPFSDSMLAVFQQPGEIIADGLYDLLVTGQYQFRFDASHWSTLLQERASWYSSLRARITDPTHERGLHEASNLLAGMSATDCVTYLLDLDADRLKWNRRLGEFSS